MTVSFDNKSRSFIFITAPTPPPADTLSWGLNFAPVEMPHGYFMWHMHIYAQAHTNTPPQMPLGI